MASTSISAMHAAGSSSLEMLTRIQVQPEWFSPYLDCRAMHQTSFQLQHSAGDLVAKGSFALMASMGRCSIGVLVTKTMSNATSRASTASMTSLAMTLDGILARCRRGFDSARFRVWSLEFGHQRRLGGAGGCGSGATSMKHCDEWMDLVWSLIWNGYCIYNCSESIVI